MDWRRQDGLFQDSELNPRRFQPIGHGAAAIPRLQPEVPDVSMFFPSTRNSTAGGGSGVRQEADSIMSTVRDVVQPTQAKPPTLNQWKPNSELSRMFQQLSQEDRSIVGNHHSGNQGSGFSQTSSNQEANRSRSSLTDFQSGYRMPTGPNEPTPGTPKPDPGPVGSRRQSFDSPLDKSGSSIQGSHNPVVRPPDCTPVGVRSDPSADSDKQPPTVIRSPHIPADIYDLLLWQQKQILSLQQQVGVLMSRSEAGSKAETLNLTGVTRLGPTTAERDSEEETQRSRHELSSTEQTEAETNHSRRVSVEASAVELSPPRQVEVDKAKENPIESRPFGFDALSRISFSDFVRNNAAFNVDFNIDSERDVRPPENIDDLMSQNSQVSIPEDRRAPQVPVDENSFTMSRLREMGVSFLNKEDLMPNSKSDNTDDWGRRDPTMFWYPRAVETQGPSMATSTSEYSMMLNSAVLKYLKDDQLAKVAQNSPSASSGIRSLQSLAPAADLTRFGVSESLLTDTTRQFLRENRLDLQ